MEYQKGGTGREDKGVEVTTYLKVMGKKLEAVLGEIKEDWEQRKQGAARGESTRRQKADMECHTCHQKGHFA